MINIPDIAVTQDKQVIRCDFTKVDTLDSYKAFLRVWKLINHTVTHTIRQIKSVRRRSGVTPEIQRALAMNSRDSRNLKVVRHAGKIHIKALFPAEAHTKDIARTSPKDRWLEANYVESSEREQHVAAISLR